MEKENIGGSPSNRIGKTLFEQGNNHTPIQKYCFVNLKVKIGNRGGLITLTDKHYKTAGGEAMIYANGGLIYKIYHDKHKALCEKKLKELHSITNPHVVVPEELIFDSTNGDVIGYTAPYLDNVEPLLKLFTKTFKQQNNIDPKMILELVKQLQLVTNDIHTAKCLIVDFNELNILVNIGPILTSNFIDVDSYATPNFTATAIMDSVRDRRVSKMINGHLSYNPDIFSDWFSWSILSFWLYTNIHPFRGNHPNYKPKDKAKQMDDGISVFHKGVRVPPTVNNFNVIPKRHLDWFEAVFLRNERGVPPLPDSIAPTTVPDKIVMIQGTDNIEVTEVGTFPDDVLNIIQLLGVNYTITTRKIYAESKDIYSECDRAKRILLCSSTDGTPIVANLTANKVTFSELHAKKVIGTIDSKDMFVRNGCIYTVSSSGKLVENSFNNFSDRIIHRVNELENVSMLTSTIFEGCIIQDLLGKKYLTFPYTKGSATSKYLSQLDKHRVIDAKMERNVAVITTESERKYNRFIIIFNKTYSDFDVRKVEDVAYDEINMTVLDTGVCLLLANPDELELFANNKNITVINNPPFDANMKLFNTGAGTFFVSGNSIHKIKKK